MEKRKNLKQILLNKKKYDLREICVGEIGLQSAITYLGIGIDKVAHWNFTPLGKERKKELFVRKDKGAFIVIDNEYKHILSGVDYKVSDMFTPNEIVIIKGSIYPFAQLYPEVMQVYYEKFGTYKINREDVKFITEYINKRPQEKEAREDEIENG